VPESVARMNSLIALFVLRKYLAVRETIIVILKNPFFFSSVCSMKISQPRLSDLTFVNVLIIVLFHIYSIIFNILRFKGEFPRLYHWRDQTEVQVQ